MSTNTKIEWTEATWNPIRGCSRVSEGCRNCYAERQAARFAGPGQPYEGLVKIAKVGDKREPRWTGKVVFDEKKLLEPLSWMRPRRVFVNSMSDLFHPDVTDVQLDWIFSVMRVCPHITFQILTKRPKRMAKYLAYPNTQDRVRTASLRWASWKRPHRYDNAPWPLQNVWCGTSVEDQEMAEERIPELFKMPAVVRWISAEPLLGPIDIRKVHIDPFEAWPGHGGLDWVVVGGESGPSARPMSLRWAHSIVQDCKSSGVPVFVKQLGRCLGTPSCASFDCTHPDCGVEWLKLKDKKGGDPSEWPEDLRVREYPKEISDAA